MYEQTLSENSVNDISNCYWNTPTLLYYLHHHQGTGAPDASGSGRACVKTTR
jgi:hypothetical protein